MNEGTGEREGGGGQQVARVPASRGVCFCPPLHRRWRSSGIPARMHPQRPAEGEAASPGLSLSTLEPRLPQVQRDPVRGHSPRQARPAPAEGSSAAGRSSTLDALVPVCEAKGTLRRAGWMRPHVRGGERQGGQTTERVGNKESLSGVDQSDPLA